MRRPWLARARLAGVKRALDHLWTDHDPDRAGVIEGEQPNTYDISIHGANSFIGTLYLAALRAAEEMADRPEEKELAAECRAVFERGRSQIEARLWNGEYLRAGGRFRSYPEQNWGIGCHSDQLLGQWWAYLLGLGHLLDPERIRSAAIAIVDHNFRESFAGHSPGAARLRHRRRSGAPDLHLAARRATGGADAVFGRSLDRVGVRSRRASACRRASRSVRCASSKRSALATTGVTESLERYRVRRPLRAGDGLLVAVGGRLRLSLRRRKGRRSASPRPSDRRISARRLSATKDGARLRQTVRDGRQTLSLTPVFGVVTLSTLRMRPLITGSRCSVALDGTPLEVRTLDSDPDLSIELLRAVRS